MPRPSIFSCILGRKKEERVREREKRAGRISPDRLLKKHLYFPSMLSTDENRSNRNQIRADDESRRDNIHLTFDNDGGRVGWL